MTKESNPIEVEFTYLPAINFAMQQNRVSVVRQLTIKNTTTDNFHNVKIVLSGEPDFASCIPYIIETIPAGETIRVDSLKLNLSATFFTQLTERLAGNFVIEIFAGEASVFKNTYPVDVLAFDQWGGLSVLPEMLSSFITPNNPAIVPIIKRASAILQQWTGNPSLDEYQSCSPDRVRKQMAAVYTAISELNIIYSTAPPSFEECGQRVRLVETILSQKLGNCLDMTLLYASCLEAIGIHPIIIVTRGHAFAGAWLVQETFSDSVIDDVSFLSKRTADGISEIALIEATCMSYGNDADFDQAVKVANDNLKKTADFVLALDVRRTRFSGIRPLPERVLNGQQWEIREDEFVETDKSLIAPENVHRYDLSAVNPEIEVTKQLMWERKLLDLSLRNNLLNIRVTKNTLQLIPADLDRFEDALSDGGEFQVMPKPTDWENPLYDFGLYQSLNSSDPIIELVKSEITQKRLRSYLPENDLQKALIHLYRSSRLSLEENGANTLYLALGLLKWYETPTSERPRYAPILLLPVEIVRKSAAKGYIVRSREEDTLINITLLEMLRQNFGITISGLDPLPVDESGVNVKLIYSIIRNGIKDQKKWDVEEQAILGIFSFSKFIMWNDIHNNSDKLAQSKIVSSLIEGKIGWEVEDVTADAAVLEKEISTSSVVLPISADSSQLEAIHEAVNGKSFILHGPPGTGKSQTITNIIANALYRGKRVLFVAEKMAALSVVQSRLASIGLGAFCLELHSNKAKKSAILSQLKDASEVVRVVSPDSFGQEAVRLHGLRTELNAYVETLHKKYPFGVSLYDAITRYLSVDSDFVFDVPLPLFDNLTKEQVQEWEDAMDTLVSTGNACGHLHGHPMTGINIVGYSAQTKEDAQKAFSTSIDLLSKIKEKIYLLSDIVGSRNANYTKTEINTLSAIVDKLLNIPELTAAMLKLPQLNEALDEYKDLVLHGLARDKAKEQVLSAFTDGILSIDAKYILADWNRNANKWFLPRYFGQKKIKKQLNLYSLKSTVGNEEVKGLLNQIIKFQTEDELISKHDKQLSILFGKYGKKNNENWAAIDQIADDTLALNSLILTYSKDIATTTYVKESLAVQLHEGISSFKSIHGNSLNELSGFLKDYQQSEEYLSRTLGINKQSLYNENSAEWIGEAVSQLTLWQNNLDKLKDWYQWLLTCEKLKSLNIGFVAEGYGTKNIPTDCVKGVFMKSFSKTAINYILSKHPELEMFKGKMFNDVIRKYKELMAEFEQLTRKEIYAKLASNIPSFTIEAAQNSEVGILQKNIRNNGRGMSIRKIFDSVPTLLSRMCPCMLMSPISAAQYIDPEADKFDLVIFDEASQMPTYEAVGAIARGKNIVVVGDPKQMPPTSFFATNTIDEEHIEMEDLESILDDCLALSMPSKYLLWHYRSKHESLIAFSNSEYYDNKLLTFPSPDNIESKVTLVPISGFYDKGKSRQNKAEAQAVIDEIARRLSDKKLQKRSIGVVTFSSVQQALIEDLLSDLFVLRPDLEATAYEAAEPLFIKNLENVQGDERDVILFSVGYGPDSKGQLSMNFGPLNRAGGERRLNVAVSRARYEMKIFSTLRADSIDLNRTSSVGVAGLKRFLEYAEKGERIPMDTQTSVQSTLSVESIIAKEIRKHGYSVHTNIGSSGYRVDIGIVDKSKSSNYLLGIICDGENYQQTKTARDREIVQNSVLRLLGWNIQRVWTLDWWENQDEVIQTILDAIKRAEENKDIEELPIVEPQKPKSAPVALPIVEPSVNRKIESIANSSVQKYKYSDLAKVRYASESFFELERKDFVLSQMREVLESEAPISRSLLVRRIMTAWDIPRLTQRYDSYFENLLSELSMYETKVADMTFFWIDEDQFQNYEIYRTDSNRDAVDLPTEEVANAIRQILIEQISLPTKDLIKLGAYLFGFARSGTSIEIAMQKGIDMAVRKEFIKVDNDRAVTI